MPLSTSSPHYYYSPFVPHHHDRLTPDRASVPSVTTLRVVPTVAVVPPYPHRRLVVHTHVSTPIQFILTGPVITVQAACREGREGVIMVSTVTSVWCTPLRYLSSPTHSHISFTLTRAIDRSIDLTQPDLSRRSTFIDSSLCIDEHRSTITDEHTFVTIATPLFTYHRPTSSRSLFQSADTH